MHFYCGDGKKSASALFEMAEDFAKWLREQFAARYPRKGAKAPHGALDAFAVDCGEKYGSTIGRYLRGVQPRANKAARIREALGKQPHYAALEEDGAGEIAESGVLGVTGIRVAGSVAAGKFRLPEEGLGRMEFSEIWRGSAYASLVDAKAEVSLIQVKGNSMEPFFPDGAWLACGKLVGKPGDLPDRAPVIATAEGLTTFKLWHVAEGRVELLPLNIALYDVQRVALEEVVIDWVVLGLIQPWVRGFGR